MKSLILDRKKDQKIPMSRVCVLILVDPFLLNYVDISAAPEKEGIADMTETTLVNLRRVIYLTIMNSVRSIISLISLLASSDFLSHSSITKKPSTSS